jgi:hypothetical protein
MVESLFVSDPYRKEESIDIKVNGRTISIKMPVGDKAGSSVLVDRPLSR